MADYIKQPALTFRRSELVDKRKEDSRSYGSGESGPVGWSGCGGRSQRETRQYGVPYSDIARQASGQRGEQQGTGK
jgi:hypothetical protein